MNWSFPFINMWSDDHIIASEHNDDEIDTYWKLLSYVCYMYETVFIHLLIFLWCLSSRKFLVNNGFRFAVANYFCQFWTFLREAGYNGIFCLFNYKDVLDLPNDLLCAVWGHWLNTYILYVNLSFVYLILNGSWHVNCYYWRYCGDSCWALHMDKKIFHVKMPRNWYLEVTP